MATEANISPAVQSLLSSSIRSIEELELLLHLRAAGLARTSADLALALHLSEGLVILALQSLVLHGMVVREGGAAAQLRYTFAPQRPELRAVVEELASMYDEHRIEMILLISSGAIDRVRSKAQRFFADSLPSRTSKKRD